MRTANPMNRIYAASTKSEIVENWLPIQVRNLKARPQISDYGQMQSNVANQKPGTSGFNTIALETWNSCMPKNQKKNTKIINRMKWQELRAFAPYCCHTLTEPQISSCCCRSERGKPLKGKCTRIGEYIPVQYCGGGRDLQPAENKPTWNKLDARNLAP